MTSHERLALAFILGLAVGLLCYHVATMRAFAMIEAAAYRQIDAAPPQ
jgi:hypothetical protein